MDVAEFRGLSPVVWPTMPPEEWTSRLQSVCGHFQPEPCQENPVVTGLVDIADAAGVELVHVANNMNIVRRGEDDIRRDYGENIFLIIQLEGICCLEQCGRQAAIGPGDCVLMDSSSPLALHFEGRFSDHLSVHLPRQLLMSGKDAPVEVARRLGAEDPMSAMLRALVAKLSMTSVEDRRAPQLRQLLFNATRQAFARDGGDDVLASHENADSRLEIAQLLIDRHLTEQRLTPDWLARRLGVSQRTLQKDFNLLDVTVKALIRKRRLYLARDQLAQMRRGACETSIAEIAYSSGFNDISYFNRSFKETFDCSPKDILRS
jgi:AraC-like DNA-binding protein